MNTRILATNRWALVPLRLLVGFGFAAHGYAKLARGPAAFAGILAAIGIPAPALMAWATSLLELVGGFALMLGVAVVPLSLPLATVMATAMFGVHLRYGFSSIRLKAVTAAGAEFGPIGYELNLLYIAALLALALAGSSPLSVDALDRKSKAPHTAASRRRRALMNVEDANRSFFTALREADAAALGSLLTDDFVLVDVMRGGEVSRADLIGAVGARQLRFDAIDLKSSRTRHYGAAAVVIGCTEMSGHVGEAPWSARSRYTHVYVEEGGRWRLASAQGTQIADD